MTWKRADELRVGMRTLGGLEVTGADSSNGLLNVTWSGYSRGPKAQTIQYQPDQEFDMAPDGADRKAPMAQRVNIVMTSDLSGDEGAESYAFGLDGQDYEIDLTPKEGEALRKALAKYVGAARQVKGRGGRRKGAAAVKGGPTAAEIREWAQANTDLEVPARGRIPNEVREAYDAAH